MFIKPVYLKCRRCGRKILQGKGMRKYYCDVKCKRYYNEVRKLSVELIKELYMLVSNSKLFSDEEIGRKMRSKDMLSKFEAVFYFGANDEFEDENKDKNVNENKGEDEDDIKMKMKIIRLK